MGRPRASTAVRKVTVNLPVTLLEQAQNITQGNLTDTLVAGLESLERRERLSALRKLRGKVMITLDLKRTRR